MKFMQPLDVQTIDLKFNFDWFSIIYILRLNPKRRGENLQWEKVYYIVPPPPPLAERQLYSRFFRGERILWGKYNPLFR